MPSERSRLAVVGVLLLLALTGVVAMSALVLHPAPAAPVEGGLARLASPADLPGLGKARPAEAEAAAFDPAAPAEPAAPDDWEASGRYHDGNATEPAPPPEGGTAAPEEDTPQSPSAPDEEPVVLPPIPAYAWTCPGGRVVEPRPTDGADQDVAGLQWMVLKTGYRFAVVWTSEVPTVGTLDYRVGLATTLLKDALPTRFHVFVVDGLPVGDDMCFRVSDDAQASSWHAVHLGNAWTQWDAAVGAYQVNLLMLADQGTNLTEVQEALPLFSTMMWDATDGQVRLGRVIVLTANVLHENVGWQHCFIDGGPPQACTYWYDVIFTLDAYSGGAASTYLFGIDEARVSIWMNWQYEAAPDPVKLYYPAADVGDVLQHEFGHYGFGMNDQWGSDGSPCSDPATEVSIMGGSGSFFETEYDDTFNRCPNEAMIPAYVPSWTSMRSRWPNVADRLTPPDPGPLGDGGLFAPSILVAV